MNASLLRHRRPRSATGRTVGWLAVVSSLAIALLGPGVASVYAFTAGDNGHPTNGPYTDLKGGTAIFTFEQNAQLTCDGNNGALGFTFKLDYSVTGTLPAGATVVVYLSPNQGAINGNANGNAAAYIAAVESNYSVVAVGGLSGTGTLTINLSVTTPFQLASGGVLGVGAWQVNTTSSPVTNKTNSLNCTDATPTPTPTPNVTPTPTPRVTPTPTPVVTPTPTPTPTPTAKPTGQVLSATATPKITLPPTSTFGGDGSGSNSDAWRLFLIGFAAIMAGVLVMTPERRKVRTRR